MTEGRRGTISMGRLFDEIRQFVSEDRYIIGEHAADRLEERDIL
jgi:hypothetical protein